jgi:hypothetical protein
VEPPPRKTTRRAVMLRELEALKASFEESSMHVGVSCVNTVGRKSANAASDRSEGDMMKTRDNCLK